MRDELSGLGNALEKAVRCELNGILPEERVHITVISDKWCRMIKLTGRLSSSLRWTTAIQATKSMTPDGFELLNEMVVA